MNRPHKLETTATPGPVGVARTPATHLQIETADNALFRAVFDSSPDALLVVDRAGTIHLANPQARQLLRWKAGSLRMESLADFLSGSAAEQLKSLGEGGTFPAAPNGFDVSLASGLPIRVALRSILPGSQRLLVSLEESSIARPAEARWRQVEAELRSVLDSVQTGIMLLDVRGEVRFSNAGFRELFGLDAGQLNKIGNFNELVGLLSGRFRRPEAVSARWKSFVAGKLDPARDELEILHPNPRVLDRLSRPVIDFEGRLVGWLEVYSDVTEQRQIQSKLLQSEKMAALGQVVSGIAHELSNPLTSIMGYAQLLLGHGLAPSQMAEARRVYQQAERARRIVKNLLYFARENKPERSPVDLNEIIERTLALRSYELKVEHIIVEFDLAPDLPRTMADPYQLQQVILNLVMNAEQALGEARGQGHIRICTRRLPQEAGDRVLLEVSDDGPGIPREIGSRIFEPFFTTKSPGVGTGLGLSIVYGIVRQHDGEVTFESRPESGAKFVIELPLVPVPEDNRAGKGVQAGSQPTAVRRGRILVVEDEPTVAQLIVDIVQEEGHRAEAVLDSRDGLALLSRQSYDLVICDLRMPRLDGRAFFRALVRTGNPLQQSILFVTGDTLTRSTLEFLKENSLSCLAKPFLVEELKLAVNHRLDVSYKKRKKALSSRRKKRARASKASRK